MNESLAGFSSLGPPSAETALSLVFRQRGASDRSGARTIIDLMVQGEPRRPVAARLVVRHACRRVQGPTRRRVRRIPYLRETLRQRGQLRGVGGGHVVDFVRVGWQVEEAAVCENRIVCPGAGGFQAPFLLP